MYNVFTEFLKDKHKICIIQAENPDGDSIEIADMLNYLLSMIKNEVGFRFI